MLKRFLALALLISFFTVLACGTSDQHPITYPFAKTVDTFNVYHGTTVSDPYRWLEDMNSDATLQWVKAQDQLLSEQLHSMDVHSKIKDRITELVNYDRYTIPIKASHQFFFMKTDVRKGKQDLYVLDEERGEERMLVDSKILPALLQMDSGAVLSTIYPSQDARYVLLAVAEEASSPLITAKLFEVSSSKITDEIKGLHLWSGTICWNKNNDGFFYVRYDIGDKEKVLTATPTNPRIYFHRTGTAQNSDRLVYQAADREHALLSISNSWDGHYLIIDERIGSQVENKIYAVTMADNAFPIQPIFNQLNANYTFLGNEGPSLFFYTNLHSPNGRIINYDLSSRNTEEVVAPQEESIMGGSLVGGNVMGYIGKRFVLGYSKNGKTFLRIFDNKGRLERTVDIPIDGSIWGNVYGNQQDEEFYYQFLGLVKPSSIYRYDLNKGSQTIFKESDIPFPADQIETRQVFYSSKDGTKIPMFITYKKNIRLDGNNPSMIFGYGAFNWISFLWYQPHLLLWLEMGGVYAQPSIRGGGEYGEQWHQAGILLNRQNAIDDYNAAAQWLIDSNYSSSDRIVATGGSASASLAAAAFLQKPNLYGAAVFDRVAMDMIRYNRFTNASGWVQEFGHPDNENEFKVLHSYSPYHTIDSATCYPPVLVMQGNLDHVAPPLHAYKFIARMQAKARHCNNPILLKMMWNVGHSFGNTPEQNIDSRTDEMTFLVKVLQLQDRFNRGH